MPSRSSRHGLRGSRVQFAFAAIVHLHRTAVRLVQQGRDVDGDEVDYAVDLRLGSRQAGAFAHGAVRPLNIAPAHLRQRTQVGGRIVDHLARHCIGAPGRVFAFGRLLIRRARRAGFLRRRLGGRAGGRLWLRAGQAADLYRGGRTEVCSRRHGGDMAGINYVRAGAGRARTAGGHPGRNGHWR